MTLEEQLRGIILSKYKSVRAFCLDANMPYMTVRGILEREDGIMSAKVTTIIQMFNHLGLDVESVSSGTIKYKSEKIAVDSYWADRIENLSESNKSKVDGYISGLMSAEQESTAKKIVG